MLEEEVRCEGESVWEMNRCGQIERDQGTKQRHKKRSSINPLAIEGPETFSIDPLAIEDLLRLR